MMTYQMGQQRYLLIEPKGIEMPGQSSRQSLPASINRTKRN